MGASITDGVVGSLDIKYSDSLARKFDGDCLTRTHVTPGRNPNQFSHRFLRRFPLWWWASNWGWLLLPVIVINLNERLPFLRNFLFREDGSNRACRFASATVDALVGVDIKLCCLSELRLILPGVNAIHRAYINTRGVFGVDARFGNNIRHGFSSAQHWVLAWPNKNHTRQFVFRRWGPCPSGFFSTSALIPRPKTHPS